jgi:hypothetical protein
LFTATAAAASSPSLRKDYAAAVNFPVSPLFIFHSVDERVLTEQF